MLYDSDIREDLCDYLEMKYGKVRFFEELVIGKSRADIVLVTEDALIGVEIKSDADSYARLPGQIKDYSRFFDMNYVVVGSSHGNHIFEHVPEHWGVLTVEEKVVEVSTKNTDDESAKQENLKTGKQTGDVDIYELRAPSPSPKVRLTNQMGLLWRSELLVIQTENGLYKYANKSKMYIKKYIMSNVDHALLKKQMLDVLFDRDYTIFEKDE